MEAGGAPSRTDGSETISVATWNIRSGRNGGLEAALRAAGALNADIVLLTEAKLTGGIYTRRFGEFSVFATDAPSPHQGGVALGWRDDVRFDIEGVERHSPNVIAFQVVTGGGRYYMVGTYVPPSCPDTIGVVHSAMAVCPKNCKPVLLGDLNANLESPRDKREEEIVEECSFWGLSSLAR